MRSPKGLIGSLSALVAAGGCATAASSKPSVDDLNHTIDALRAQNAAQTKQLEEFQNRVFILQDRLDSSKVAAEQQAQPMFPVVTLHPPDGPPNQNTLEYPASTDVEYVGEAAHTSTRRPALKLQGDETPVFDSAEPDRPVEIRSASGRAPRIARTDRIERKATAASEPGGHAPADVVVVPAPRSKPLPSAAVAAAAPKAAPARIASASALKSASAPRPTPAGAAPGHETPALAAKPAPAPAVSVASAPAPKVAASAPPKAALDPPPADAPPAPAPAPEPLRLYRQGLDLLKERRHAEAVAALREFVAKYPAHDYADNAQYWLGECFYDLKDHRAAVREFRDVVDKFPEGNKVPDALLKAGYSYLALGEAAAGREALGQVMKAYPRHQASRLAETRLRELDKPAAGDEPPPARPTEAR